MRIVTIVLFALSTAALTGCPDKDAKPDPAATGSAKPTTTTAPAATSAAAPAKSGAGW